MRFKESKGFAKVVSRDMRRDLKRAGFKRPVAILRARRKIAGLVGRGGWFSTMLDFNRDFRDLLNGGKPNELRSVLDSYGDFLLWKRERGRPLRIL